MPLNPGKELFHQPAPFITTQSTAILCPGYYPIPAMRLDYLNTHLTRFLVQLVAVVRAISNQEIVLCLDRAEVETQLHQDDFMVVRRMRDDRQWQPVTINNYNNLQSLATINWPDLIIATLRRCKRGIDNTFRFIQRAFIVQRVGRIDEHTPQDFVAAPLLEATKHCFVVQVALRQQAPLGTGIEVPEHGFDDLAGRCRLAA